MAEYKMIREETASVFVDAQKGFTPLQPYELPVPKGDQIVPALMEQLQYARLKIATKDAHNRNAIWIANEQNPIFTPVEGENVDIRWPSHCIAGETGAELLDGLPAVTEYDYFVWKGMEPDMHPYGACYHDLADKLSTGLIEYLDRNDITNVIVGGLATDYCVKTTCLQLANRMFDVVLNLEGCRGVAPETTEQAIVEMENNGIIVIRTLEDLRGTFE